MTVPCRETEPTWDQDIAADVKDECSKYGPVSHVHVDKDSKVQWPHAYAALDLMLFELYLLNGPLLAFVTRWDRTHALPCAGFCVPQVWICGGISGCAESSAWEMVCQPPDCGRVPVYPDLQQLLPPLRVLPSLSIIVSVTAVECVNGLPLAMGMGNTRECGMQKTCFL